MKTWVLKSHRDFNTGGMEIFQYHGYYTNVLSVITVMTAEAL